MHHLACRPVWRWQGEMKMASGIKQHEIRRPDKLTLVSPHGLLLALSISILLWVGILSAVGVIH
jgi:hypothetical protein